MATIGDYRTGNPTPSNGLTSEMFNTHLVALLSVYETGPSPAPLPQYNGPTDWQTDNILRSLASMARRMYTAEQTLDSIRDSETWQDTNGPDTKKRRSLGDVPAKSPSSSSGSSDYVTPGRSPSIPFTNGFISSSPSSTPSDVEMPSVDDAGTLGPGREQLINGRAATPMTISLEGIHPSIDAAKLFSHSNVGNTHTSTSAPPTSHADHVMCPTCGKAITDSITMSRVSSAFTGSPSGSPLVVPPGPLAAAAFESGMSAVEELRLLKAQVQDVARVCNAVARGDLSQKITVPVQGVVMVQLKDVINTMVS
jgi:osomolarity two-component system, sensor histidine kinase NIK1